jgi:uncharacterized DUF497 family protein
VDIYTEIPYRWLKFDSLSGTKPRHQAIWLKHRIEFSYATNVFLDPARVDLDLSRPGDREMRRNTIGIIDGRLLAVVYTVRTESIRIISARRSNSSESEVYGPIQT